MNIKIVPRFSINRERRVVKAISSDRGVNVEGRDRSLVWFDRAHNELHLSTAYDWEICPSDQRGYLSIRAYTKVGENYED